VSAIGDDSQSSKKPCASSGKTRRTIEYLGEPFFVLAEHEVAQGRQRAIAVFTRRESEE
jgi:hypothetical protein